MFKQIKQLHDFIQKIVKYDAREIVACLLG